MNPDQFRHIMTAAGESFNPPPAEIPRDAMWSRIRLARDYNRPQSAVPREEMWERLAHSRPSSPPAPLSWKGRAAGRARIAGRDVRELSQPARKWMIFPLASLAAAALFTIIPAGTLTEPATQGTPASVVQSNLDVARLAAYQNDRTNPEGAEYPGRWYPASVDDPVSEAFRRAAIAHLRRSDVLITGFHALSNNALTDRTMRATAGELLSNTRLLLNSPASIQAQYRGVFLDLELVLVKITLLTPGNITTDRGQIEATLARKKLLPRMRELIPTPSSSNAN